MTVTQPTMLKSILLAAIIVVAGCSQQPPPDRAITPRGNLPEWSKTEAGLRCRLTLPSDSFALEDAIPFTLEIENTSDAAVTFQLSRYMESLRIQTEDGKEMPYRGPSDMSPALLITLQPTTTYRIALTVIQENYLLVPNTYVAHFEESESGGASFTAVTLKTPRVKCKVLPKKDRTP